MAEPKSAFKKAIIKERKGAGVFNYTNLLQESVEFSPLLRKGNLSNALL